ncbi:MAG: NAD(+) diphosphatase [Lachnospiraceae bacterium]|nr:NAD(+) diphosphatase [Lachnospiraceae bacterium]
MIQDIGKHRFRNEYHPEAVPRADSKVLFYRGREIFVKCEEEQICFLTFEKVSEVWPEAGKKMIYLFSIDGVSYFLIAEFEMDTQKLDLQEACKSKETENLLASFPGYSWVKIERMRTVGPKEAAFAGVTGLQLYEWYNSRRFCPACGKHMIHSEKERMMHCPACGQIEYPKICPAVIVAVTDGDRILLTKYAGRSFRNYALIAGFAEIGETLEETVEREVMEEVGLRVKNIRYYKSQPWSFTDTLLAGFFAEVDRDTHIHMDENELSVAKWCTREEVPEDDGVSLTREMMGVFKSGRQPV